MDTRLPGVKNPDRIILATDFSPASSTGVLLAGSVARVFGISVTILHAFQYVPFHSYQFPVEWMLKTIRKDVHNKLEETKRIFFEAGIEAETTILDGAPVQQIPKFLQSFRAPILVMGTHAARGIERFFVGSTAEEILRLARWPVITVGPHVPAITGSDHCFRKVLYATDFSEASLAALPFVDTFRRACAAKLLILHVSKESTRSPKDEDLKFDVIRKLLLQHSAEESDDAVEYVTVHGTQVSGTQVSRAIVHEAERYLADMLTMGVHRTSAFAAHLAPKTAFQVIAAAPCAVLTVSS
jgi:nucleotide-binding universal stress UspA family protein